jgi:hypothetical protein
LVMTNARVWLEASEGSRLPVSISNRLLDGLINCEPHWAKSTDPDSVSTLQLAKAEESGS